MKLKKQPKKSMLCGQTCVAMIRGCSIQKAIVLCKKKGATKSRHLYKGLGKEIRLNKRFTINSKQTIVFIRWYRSKIGHWVVYHNKKIYDPGLDKPMNLSKYRKLIKPKGYIDFCLNL